MWYFFAIHAHINRCIYMQCLFDPYKFTALHPAKVLTCCWLNPAKTPINIPHPAAHLSTVGRSATNSWFREKERTDQTSHIKRFPSLWHKWQKQRNTAGLSHFNVIFWLKCRIVLDKYVWLNVESACGNIKFMWRKISIWLTDLYIIHWM